MRVFVTGATSPLGRAVAAHFTRGGHQVRGLVRTPDQPAPPATELVVGDVTDPAMLMTAVRDVDVAIHCAASHASDLAQCYSVNVVGTRQLCDALLSSPMHPRLVHVSTISVYDDAAGPSFDEDSPLTAVPDSPYAFSKAEAERGVREAAARGLAAVVLRPSMILSTHPRARWGPLAVARARVSNDCLVPFPELPYTHVDNVVAAIDLAARAPAAPGRAYNLVDAVADSREYLDAIYAAAGKPAPPIPADAPRLRFAAKRIRQELNWRPVDKWREFLAEIRALA